MSTPGMTKNHGNSGNGGSASTASNFGMSARMVANIPVMSALIEGQRRSRSAYVGYLAATSAGVSPSRAGSSSRAWVAARSISAMSRWKPAIFASFMYGRNWLIISPPLGARPNIWNANGAAISPTPSTRPATNGQPRAGGLFS
jgi:hypothetical protein